MAEGRGVEPLTMKPPSRYSTPVASQPGGTFREVVQDRGFEPRTRRASTDRSTAELDLREVETAAGVEPAFAEFAIRPVPSAFAVKSQSTEP